MARLFEAERHFRRGHRALDKGDAARAIGAFERAVALSEGRNLLARVLFAEHYARLVFDRELHDEQLRQVLDAEPDVPDLTLQGIAVTARHAMAAAGRDETED